MNFSKKLRENYRCGKCTIVQNEFEDYNIFSTPNADGELRQSEWNDTIEKCKEEIGTYDPDTDRDIDNFSEHYSWRIIGTIDFSELGGEGYKEGEKVRILRDAKEKCEKSGLSWSDDKEKRSKAGWGFITGKEGSNYLVDGWTFPASALEPFLEEEKVEEMTAEEICKELGRNIKIIK